jgi:hypothetical protein
MKVGDLLPVNQIARCAATRSRLDPTLPPKQCARAQTHGEWCRQHAESLGGWRLVDPLTLDRLQRSVGDFLWLGNNLHNAGSDTFRRLYKSALPEARRAYDDADRLPMRAHR